MFPRLKSLIAAGVLTLAASTASAGDVFFGFSFYSGNVGLSFYTNPPRYRACYTPVVAYYQPVAYYGYPAYAYDPWWYYPSTCYYPTDYWWYRSYRSCYVPPVVAYYPAPPCYYTAGPYYNYWSTTVTVGGSYYGGHHSGRDRDRDRHGAPDYLVAQPVSRTTTESHEVLTRPPQEVGLPVRLAAGTGTRSNASGNAFTPPAGSSRNPIRITDRDLPGGGRSIDEASQPVSGGTGRIERPSGERPTTGGTRPRMPEGSTRQPGDTRTENPVATRPGETPGRVRDPRVPVIGGGENTTPRTRPGTRDPRVEPPNFPTRPETPRTSPGETPRTRTPETPRTTPRDRTPEVPRTTPRGNDRPTVRPVTPRVDPGFGGNPRTNPGGSDRPSVRPETPRTERPGWQTPRTDPGTRPSVGRGGDAPSTPRTTPSYPSTRVPVEPRGSFSPRENGFGGNLPTMNPGRGEAIRPTLPQAPQQPVRPGRSSK